MGYISYHIEENIKITEMYTFFKACYDNTYEFSGETHDFWECVYVIDGEICVSADSRVYNLSGGQIIFHKPLELHKFHVTSKKGVQILVFSFSAEGLLCNFFHNKVFSLDEKQKYILYELMEYAETNLASGDNMYTMYLYAFNKVNLYSQNVGMYICRLLLSLAENTNILPVSKSYHSVIFTKAVKFMAEKLYENPSIEDVSNHVNVSVSSIKRIFNRYAGMGVHKYFLKLKIKAATQMLREGYSVTFVAEKLNFSSQGYFTKTFKRETGTLPSDLKI